MSSQYAFKTLDGRPDGVTNWNERRAVQRHFPLTAARIELSGGSSHSMAAPAKSIFDNFVLSTP